MFESAKFFPQAIAERITATRVDDPEFAARSAQARIRRPRLAPDGMLNILAADHPARNVTKVGGDALAMADRRDYLARVARVLTSPRVDGVMATMDILEDLFTIDGFLRKAGAPPLLDHKLVVASLNRGGLAGSCWELDDPITGPTPAGCRAWNLDGAKILLRVDAAERDSLKTMLASAAAIDECNALAMPMFLEPLPVARTDKGYTVVKTADALARIVGVASALGNSSRYLWLKLPYAENYELVARATTLPILLLGGESAGDPGPFLRQLEGALKAGANVRGALVGRNVLYPGTEDPLGMADAVGGAVHDGWPVERALRAIASGRGSAMDRLRACL